MYTSARLCKSKGLFLESSGSFSGPESYFACVCCIYIQDQSLNNFDNNVMKLSVNEAKLTGLWARNFATIQQVLILKFAFRSEKFPGLSRNEPHIQMFWYDARATLNLPESMKNTYTKQPGRHKEEIQE